MDPFIKQDIFFFVSTIAVALLAVTMTIVMVYVIKILNDVKYISKKAKLETDHLAEDLNDLRENVKEQGFKVKHAFSFFNSFMNRRKK